MRILGVMLDMLFNPDKVAVVGASRQEGKTGHEVFDNLFHNFDGRVTPVNPNAVEVEGEEARDDIPDNTDLVVVAVPAKLTPKVMEDAAEKNVKAAIIISAGFSETGQSKLEEKVIRIAKENNIDVLGPNVLGLINTENSMNASFASKMPEEGGISFMSQSGAFCTAILDYAKAEHIGFRHFVSLGNKSMLNEVDFLKKWKDDSTEAILSYTEGIENGREFMEVAEKTSREKPIIAVKSGRTSKGSDAASSHTGSIAGSYQAYKAAFRKSGVIEAESNRELLDFGRAFAYQPLPEGKNIMIITNAGGPGVVSTDEVSQRNLNLADLETETKMELHGFMPSESTIRNPLDLIGDAGHTRYRKALETVGEDENVDGILVLLTPQANTEIEKTAKTIVKAEKKIEKPIFACFMGEYEVRSGIEILEENNIPDFEDPVDAVKTFKAMNDYRKFLETERHFIDIIYDGKKAEKALDQYDGYMDGHNLLEAYGFNLPMTKNADAPHPAEEAAVDIGYPVVMKINSPDIAHKTDIGGVKSGVSSRQEVNDAFNKIVNNVHHNEPGSKINGVIVQEQMEGLEIALGMKRDPQFGPMIMVGLGGIYIEALHDISFGIAPISEEEAEQMIFDLQASELFQGARGKEYSMSPIKDAIIRLGEIAMNHKQIQEIDINPLILKGDKAYAADVQIEIDES